MVVHICCSVDSFYYIKKLKEELPNEKLIGFFYDPNIHPYSEYYLRMLDSKRSCEDLGIQFIEGSYDFENWFNSVRGLEKEPEKGARCKVCFDTRLEETAKKAQELGESKITTTLLMSPKKDFSQLQSSANLVERKYGVEFAFFDFRKGGGTQAQFAMAKEKNAYKQNYCGCMFALNNQREIQQRSTSELYSDLNNKVLPNSIEERVKIYEQVVDLEKENRPYKIEKRNFINYRLLWGKVTADKQTVRSHILPYSHASQKRFQTHFFSLQDLKLTFEDLKNMSFQEEMKLREKLGFDNFDFSVVILLENIENVKYKVELKSEIFNDTRETLTIQLLYLVI
ncbi:MAG: epoxyqueuosine reductase QueH [Campylobacterales bacterium]|nr:epoxyqueuosine reductase QueH [Campylobacterales bacterium]